MFLCLGTWQNPFPHKCNNIIFKLIRNIIAGKLLAWMYWGNLHGSGTIVPMNSSYLYLLFTDVDECNQFAGRGRLCGGTCQNIQGSYRCTCPDGWRLMGNGRSCHGLLNLLVFLGLIWLGFKSCSALFLIAIEDKEKQINLLFFNKAMWFFNMLGVKYGYTWPRFKDP